MSKETENPPEYDQEANGRPTVFLKLGCITIVFAVMIYVLMGSNRIVDDNGIGSVFYFATSFLLMIFVLLSLFFVMCFTSPRIGHAVLKRAQYLEDAWGTPMRFLSLGGVSGETISDDKRLGTQRKYHRAERRKYARMTKTVRRSGDSD